MRRRRDRKAAAGCRSPAQEETVAQAPMFDVCPRSKTYLPQQAQTVESISGLTYIRKRISLTFFVKKLILWSEGLSRGLLSDATYFVCRAVTFFNEIDLQGCVRPASPPPFSERCEISNSVPASNLAQLPPAVHSNCSERLWLHAKTFLVALEN